jgi:hypothetical protein
MSRAPVIAVAAVVATAAGFGAAALTSGGTAAATGQLSEAKVASAAFTPPRVGTTSVPALRVVRHHAAKKRNPVRPPHTVVQVDPPPTAATPSAPTYTAPAQTAPARSNPQPAKPRPGGSTDTIGPTEGGGN